MYLFYLKKGSDKGSLCSFEVGVGNMLSELFGDPNNTWGQGPGMNPPL